MLDSLQGLSISFALPRRGIGSSHQKELSPSEIVKGPPAKRIQALGSHEFTPHSAGECQGSDKPAGRLRSSPDTFRQVQLIGLVRPSMLEF